MPLLRKDFIIDERQILEAVEWGADAILLIVAILSDAQLKRFHELATGAGLAALVEVHDEAELDRALHAGARTDWREQPQPEDLQGGPGHDRAARRAHVPTQHATRSTPPSPLLVAESGIHTRADVERLAKCGAQAILVGESLIEHADIGAKVRELLGG